MIFFLISLIISISLIQFQQFNSVPLKCCLRATDLRLWIKNDLFLISSIVAISLIQFQQFKTVPLKSCVRAAVVQLTNPADKCFLRLCVKGLFRTHSVDAPQKRRTEKKGRTGASLFISSLDFIILLYSAVKIKFTLKTVF